MGRDRKNIKNVMENNIKQLVSEVLETGYLMSLATYDNGGVWVSDVIYVYDDELNIYWMSDSDTRHSQAILKNPQVAGTVTISGKGEDNLGIQFEGAAEKIEESRPDLAIKHRVKRGKPLPKLGQDILENGELWYVVKPEKIELIYEKLFGFNKQKLEL